MADRRRAAWIDEQDKARPATAIERAILECRETARLSGADIAQGGESKTVHGPQAFAARLDQAGLAIVRVTGTDMEALAELRSEESLARDIARTNGEAYRPHHFAEGLSAGDLAAVTRRGDVYQLNAHRLDIEAIAASLESAGAGKDEALPSVTEARVAFLIERNVDAALRDEAREEAREARIEHSAEWDADLETARTIEEAERDMRDVTEASEDVVNGAAAGIGRGVEKVLGAALNAVANFIAPPPPPTKEQVKVMREQAEFRADLATWAAEQAAQSNSRTTPGANSARPSGKRRKRNGADGKTASVSASETAETSAPGRVAAATQRGPSTASAILQLFRAAWQALTRPAGDDQQHGAGEKKRSGQTGRGLIMALTRRSAGLSGWRKRS